MVNYVTQTGGKPLEDKLAEEVFRLVSTSILDANKKYRTYDPRAIEASLTPWMPENLKQWNVPLVAILAYEEEKLIGTAILRHRDFDDLPKGQSACISGMYVDPDYQGRGVGTNILNMLKAEARKNGIKIIRGHASDFPGVIDYYLKNGFVNKGEINEDVGEGLKLKFHQIEMKL